MENVELHNHLSKKIKKTSSLIKVFGILSIVFFVAFIISTFLEQKKSLCRSIPLKKVIIRQ